MSTDRELLEKAAKAAGNGARFRSADAFGLYDMIIGSSQSWNPLDDDGDAIRLAVALELSVNAYSSYVIIADQHADFEGRDRMAVVRRTIVRAAAAIGDHP